MKLWTLLATVAVAIAGCSRPAPPPAVQNQLEQAHTAEVAPPIDATPTSLRMRIRPQLQGNHLVWVDAQPSADVQRAVRAERRRAQVAGQTLLVYVGATWCEPCRYFHEAAVAGRLDEPLGNLRILAFDADRDHAQLDANGYTSKMIPLFATPGDDGKAAGPRLAGAIKGPEAVDYLVPRLRELLGASRVPPPASATPTSR